MQLQPSKFDLRNSHLLLDSDCWDLKLFASAESDPDPKVMSYAEDTHGYTIEQSLQGEDSHPDLGAHRT